MSQSTSGPWRWELSEKSKDVRLVGRNDAQRLDYDLTVMDFVRYGMSGAAPRFRTDRAGMNIMKRVEEWGSIVPGREHHAHWHKFIDHPDALLIASAPDMQKRINTLACALRDICAEVRRDTRGEALASIARNALELAGEEIEP